MNSCFLRDEKWGGVRWRKSQWLESELHLEFFYVFSEISVTVYIHNEDMKSKIWNWRLGLAIKLVLGMHTGNVYRRKKSYWILFLSSDYKNIGECVTINCAYKAGCKFLSKNSVKKTVGGGGGAAMTKRFNFTPVNAISHHKSCCSKNQLKNQKKGKSLTIHSTAVPLHLSWREK